MDAIFHEEQEGSLCAQHCLNALLQGQYFSAVDLADIARQLDETERLQMAEAGTQSMEYQRFMQQGSTNFDDSGFFSIQVIDKALQVWGLSLVQYNSQDAIAKEARRSPVAQHAYICNFRDHWFCVRKIGHQWFNLNSLLTGPELISDTYLSLFLTQLQQEGYSILIVTGRLPECEANDILKLAPAVQLIKPRLINENQSISKSDAQSDDPELQRALAESRCLEEQDDKMLQRALQMSMEGYVIEDINVPGTSQKATDSRVENTQEPTKDVEGPSQDELRKKRLAFLNKLDQSSSGSDNHKSCHEQTDSSNKTDKHEYDSCNQNNQDTCSCSTVLGSKKSTCKDDTKSTTPLEDQKPKQQDSSKSTSSPEQKSTQQELGEITEDEMLKQAIAMSMETQ